MILFCTMRLLITPSTWQQQQQQHSSAGNSQSKAMSWDRLTIASSC
jgi:hypothetical protein